MYVYCQDFVYMGVEGLDVRGLSNNPTIMNIQTMP